MLPSAAPRRSVSREPVSRMQLVFDEDDDRVQESEVAAAAADPQTSRVGEGPGLPDAPWGLGELRPLGTGKHIIRSLIHAKQLFVE